MRVCCASNVVLPNTDVVASHETPGVAMINYLDAGQPFDVSHTVPTRGDQAHRKPMLRRQGRAVHLVAEQVRRVECFSDRHAAGELLPRGVREQTTVRRQIPLRLYIAGAVPEASSRVRTTAHGPSTGRSL